MRNAFNTLMFTLRNQLAWRRPGYTETPEDKTQWLASLPDSETLAATEARLIETYHLADFKARSGRLRYAEALSLLLQLETMTPNGLALPQGPEATWLDIGSKNWGYVDTLVAFGTRARPDMQFIGVELDAYGIYPDGHSRADYAHAFAAPYPQAQYRVADALSITGQYAVVSCFLPFVFPDPHLAWGLPLSRFNPQRFCNHLLSLVAPGGTLLITNQGPQEQAAQAALIAQSPLAPQFTPLWQGPLPNTFYPYHHPRTGSSQGAYRPM